MIGRIVAGMLFVRLIIVAMSLLFTEGRSINYLDARYASEKWQSRIFIEWLLPLGSDLLHSGEVQTFAIFEILNACAAKGDLHWNIRTMYDCWFSSQCFLTCAKPAASPIDSQSKKSPAGGAGLRVCSGLFNVVIC